MGWWKDAKEWTREHIVDDLLGIDETSWGGELIGLGDKKRAREMSDIAITAARDARRAEEDRLWGTASRLAPFVGMGRRSLRRLKTGDYGPTSRRFKYELARGRETIAGTRAAKGVLRSSGTQTRMRQLVGGLAGEEIQRKEARLREISRLGATSVSMGGFVTPAKDMTAQELQDARVDLTNTSTGTNYAGLRPGVAAPPNRFSGALASFMSKF